MRWSRVIPFVLSAIVALILMQVDARVLAQGKSGSKKAQPQQSDDKDKAKTDDANAKKDDDQQPKNIMGGKSLGLKSSRQERDSATMGFNGLDPQGKVEKSMLAAYANTYDIVDAKSLVAYNPVPKELDEFVQKGQLKPPAPPATPANTRDEKKKDKKK
jgi:hypothetical protein